MSETMRWQSRIWELGRARGWSGQQLARELGVAYSTLWRVREGRCEPSTRLIYRSAEVFCRPPGELWWQERAPEEVGA